MNQQATQAVHAVLGEQPPADLITRLLADLIIYCRDRGIRLERYMLDAVLLAAAEDD